jgi:hypothetical protein
MQSEVVNTGLGTWLIAQNYYQAGDSVNLKYRTGNSVANCQAAELLDYSVPFESLGYVQIRIES